MARLIFTASLLISFLLIQFSAIAQHGDFMDSTEHRRQSGLHNISLEEKNRFNKELDCTTISGNADNFLSHFTFSAIEIKEENETTISDAIMGQLPYVDFNDVNNAFHDKEGFHYSLKNGNIYTLNPTCTAIIMSRYGKKVVYGGCKVVF